MRPRSKRERWRRGRSSATRGPLAPSCPSSGGDRFSSRTLDLGARKSSERAAQSLQKGDAIGPLLTQATVALEHRQRDHRRNGYAAPFDDHGLFTLPDVGEQTAEVLPCCCCGHTARALGPSHRVSTLFRGG